MANTQPTFLRRFEVFARISYGKTAIILEPVQITLGFSGPVDPDSGMVLNLTEVDAWIAAFKKSTVNKTYADRWAMSRLVTAKLKSLIDRKEFTQVNFKFHNLEILIKLNNLTKNGDVFLKWHQQSVLSTAKLKWMSPVVLHLKSKSKKWPQITPAQEAKILKALKSVQVEKQKWAIPGLLFEGFEYIDPKLAISVKVGAKI